MGAGCAMAHAVSCQPLNREAQVRAQMSPYGICGTGAGFSPSSSVLLFQKSF
jgi:hypothetical protein